MELRSIAKLVVNEMPKLALLFIVVLIASPCAAQIQIGTVQVVVVDPTGARVPDADISLSAVMAGVTRTGRTDARGEAKFENVPFGLHTAKVSAGGFQDAATQLDVRSNLLLERTVTLSVASRSQNVTVDEVAPLVSADPTSATHISKSLVEEAPDATRAGQLQRLVAMTPGVVTQNNGLLHFRGVEDGFMYVFDGIPVLDRIDLLHAVPPDTEAIESLTVITGNVPAEFGGRNAAVVNVRSKSGIGESLRGTSQFAAGNYRSAGVAQSLSGGWRSAGFFAAVSASTTDQYLDPVHPLNFKDRGGIVGGSIRGQWRPKEQDLFLVGLMAGGTNFRVPNDAEQNAAGQRQSQRLRNHTQEVSWQRSWSASAVTNLAYYRRTYGSRLFPSEFDTPITATQDRQHTRQGVIGSMTRGFQSHILKAGVNLDHVSINEFFQFAITDPVLAEERDVSEAAAAYGPSSPFVFSGRLSKPQWSAYVQDEFRLLHNLNVSVGLRYDRSQLVTTASQLSPRIGMSYFVERTGTALRASFNRMFMPPQIENLLLSASPGAKALSPFAGEGGGGSDVQPERVSAYEVGITQSLSRIRFDAAFWRRSFSNFADANVFFNTTVIFANSVAEGLARGIDLRLELPAYRDWAGFVSYTNSRVGQTGPINGGLFLTDEFLEIGPGTRFTPDHDQRNVAALGVVYSPKWRGFTASATGRYESGVPLELEADDLDALRNAPGSDLVNFTRQRVKPWAVIDLAVGVTAFRRGGVLARWNIDVENAFNRRFAYHFGNPFEGTHFGKPRRWRVGLKLEMGD